MQQRLTLHRGLPNAPFSSMPTCGLCQVQIKNEEEYAAVLIADGSRREVRHHTVFCSRYEYGPAAALESGALVHTHRYMLTDWGGRIPAVVVEKTEEFGEFGWRKYLLAPESRELVEAEIEKFRTHREASFRKMAESLAVDMEPRPVFISDTEWTHYVLPK